MLYAHKPRPPCTSSVKRPNHLAILNFHGRTLRRKEQSMTSQPTGPHAAGSVSPKAVALSRTKHDVDFWSMSNASRRSPPLLRGQDPPPPPAKPLPQLVVPEPCMPPPPWESPLLPTKLVLPAKPKPMTAPLRSRSKEEREAPPLVRMSGRAAQLEVLLLKE